MAAGRASATPADHSPGSFPWRCRQPPSTLPLPLPAWLEQAWLGRASWKLKRAEVQRTMPGLNGTPPRLDRTVYSMNRWSQWRNGQPTRWTRTRQRMRVGAPPPANLPVRFLRDNPSPARFYTPIRGYWCVAWQATYYRRSVPDRRRFPPLRVSPILHKRPSRTGTRRHRDPHGRPRRP